MCRAIPSSALCGGDESVQVPPTMKMYFHTGINDYILFSTWVPNSTGTFVASCFAVGVMGFVLEALHILGIYLEQYWTRKTKGDYSFTSFGMDTERFIYVFVYRAWAYLVMLITMTFNVALFVCVCVGIALGHVCFWRLRAKLLDNSGYSVKGEWEENMQSACC
jgi:copper transporter 1